MFYVRIILILFASYLTPLYAQEIKSNTVDPFTNERTIETTLVPVKQGLSSGFGISYMALGTNYYLNMVGYKSNNFTIAPDDKIWMVLEDGHVVQINERARTEGDETEAKNVFIYHYFVTMNDIEMLKTKKIAIVRIAGTGGTQRDVAVAGKLAKKIQKLHELFFNEVNKLPTSFK